MAAINPQEGYVFETKYDTVPILMPYPISGFPAPPQQYVKTNPRSTMTKALIYRWNGEKIIITSPPLDQNDMYRNYRGYEMQADPIYIDEMAYIYDNDVTFPVTYPTPRFQLFSFEKSWCTDVVLHPKQVAHNFRKRMRLAQLDKWMPVEAWLQLLYEWCAPSQNWPYM